MCDAVSDIHAILCFSSETKWTEQVNLWNKTQTDKTLSYFHTPLPHRLVSVFSRNSKWCSHRSLGAAYEGSYSYGRLLPGQKPHNWAPSRWVRVGVGVRHHFDISY